MPVIPDRVPRSFQTGGAQSFGERLFRFSSKPYTEKSVGQCPAKTSPRWAAQRIKGWILARSRERLETLVGLKPKAGAAPGRATSGSR